MGHLLLPWMSARLGFPIWKWFLWKTSHCCWLPVRVVRQTEGQEGSEPLNSNPKSSLVWVRWKLLKMVLPLTGSLTKHIIGYHFDYQHFFSKPLKNNLVYFWFKVVGPGSEMHREHLLSITETLMWANPRPWTGLSSSPQAYPVGRWHHTEDLWLVCPKFHE